MGRYKEPVYRPHPLLEELRPRLKASARKHLEKSILRVGQLHPVLVTMDDYILDGRERFELMRAMNLRPQIRQLNFYSGVDAKALPNAGFSLEDELQTSREVIEETGRGKWQNSQARREESQSVSQDVSQSVGQDVSQDVSQSVGQDVSQDVSRSVGTIAERIEALLRASPGPMLRNEIIQELDLRSQPGRVLHSLLMQGKIRVVESGPVKQGGGKAFLYWHP
jgi:hypothetical protein